MTVYPEVRTSADLLKSTIRIEELIPFLIQQKAKAVQSSIRNCTGFCLFAME